MELQEVAGVKQKNRKMCIAILLQEAKDTTDMKSQIDRENRALQFWNNNNHLKNTTGRKISERQVAINFEISSQRMSYIIENPDSIVRKPGAKPRLDTKDEIMLISWTTQRSQAFIATDMRNIIEIANEINSL